MVVLPRLVHNFPWIQELFPRISFHSGGEHVKGTGVKRRRRQRHDSMRLLHIVRRLKVRELKEWIVNTKVIKRNGFLELRKRSWRLESSPKNFVEAQIPYTDLYKGSND